MSRFPRVRAWFADHTLLEPALLAAASFDDVIAARVHELRLPGDAEYLALLGHDELEAARAQAMVAVPETWLFRVRASFDFLYDQLAARRLRGDQQLRMLSAGSAHGAEACSMVAAALAAGWPIDRVIVDAIDQNPDAIGIAAQGCFSGMALREGLPGWAEGRFPQDGEVRRADADLLGRIRFHRADLFAWTPARNEAPFDIVFCRNVLIYLQQAARRRLVALVDSWLANDGLLFVGHADAANDLASRFRPLQPIGAFVFERIGNPEPSPAPLPRGGRSGAGRPPARRRPKDAPTTSPPTRSDYETASELRSRGRLDEAEPLLRRLLRRRPGDAASLLLLGEVLLGRGQPEEAEAVFQKLVYLDPDHEIGLLHLAEIAEHAGRLAQADRFRERALNAHLRREGEHEAR